MKKYFGFAVADSMFPENCTMKKKTIKGFIPKAEIESAISCVNPSHQATIDALHNRYGIQVVVPDVPPKVSLNDGDELIVMSVRGLPRLTDRHEYTQQEIDSATFTFSVYTIGAAKFAQREACNV